MAEMLERWEKINSRYMENQIIDKMRQLLTRKKESLYRKKDEVVMNYLAQRTI